jgi:FKBP-type peptidyl-prolyl cis-trans isomerase
MAVALAAAGCDNQSTPTDPSQVTIEFGFSDLTVGSGAEAAAGRTVTVHYTLWLYNPAGVESKGTRVQSSLDAGTPYTFTVGSRQTIPGFEQGVVGMRAGGKRRVYVPANLAYGSAGSQGGIPPNAALVFEIELVSVQ